MRTAIILGFSILATAISNSAEYIIGDESAKTLGWVVMIMMVMDIIDFIRGEE